MLVVLPLEQVLLQFEAIEKVCQERILNRDDSLQNRVHFEGCLQHIDSNRKALLDSKTPDQESRLKHCTWFIHHFGEPGFWLGHQNWYLEFSAPPTKDRI